MNDILPEFGSFLVRATLLICGGLLVATFLQRRRPLVASSVLNATTICLLILPPLTALLAGCAAPTWKLPEFQITNRLAETLSGNPGNATRMEPAFEAKGIAGPQETPPGAVASLEGTTRGDSGERSPHVQPPVSHASTPSASAGGATWPWILASIYLTGVAILFTRLINSLRVVNEVRRTALPFRGDWALRLAHWRECLGVTRPVELVASHAVTVPMTVGRLRPMILVPTSMQSVGAQHQDAILLHELAHIRRSDYFHLILLQIAQIMYWWHPLTWTIAPLGRQLCERACDELCVHWIGNRTVYCDSLIEIARQTICRPRLALGLAMAHASHLSRRVAHLGRSGGSERCVPRKAVRIGVFGGGLSAVMLVALIQLGPAAASSSAQNDKAEKAAKNNQGAGAGDQGKADAARKARPDSAVNRLLDRLDELRPKSGEDEWAMVLRDLVDLGPDAVPELIAEMDASNNEYMLRCLAFVMRGIGDKRAIPALIRTLPKTCVPPCSDYGYIARDPTLLAFMQEHDLQEGPIGGGTHYSFGRAINEYRVTLQKMTGTHQNELEIIHVFLQGTPRQKGLQRQLYQQCAQNWADWWKMHWQECVSDEKDARLELASLETGANSANDFPHGPGVKIDGRHSNHVLESPRNPNAKVVFLDLDTGRSRGLPDHLKLAGGQPKRLDDVLAWAAREGFDLMGTEYSPPKSEKSHYVLRGLGLNAWQVETDLWKQIETELKKPEPMKMGPRIDGLLAQFDPKAGQYLPQETATFLFQTREGGYGAIFVGVEVHDDRMPVGGGVGNDDELRPVAFSKGRRFAYTLISMDESEKSKDARKP